MIESMSQRQEKKTRATVTLDADLVGRVKKRVGERGVSAYLNKALRGELQHEAMRAYLERTEREYGPIPQQVLDDVQRALDESFDRVDRLRNRRKSFSALVKPTASQKPRPLADIERRAKAALEKELGIHVAVDAVSDTTLVVNIVEPTKGRRTA